MPVTVTSPPLTLPEAEDELSHANPAVLQARQVQAALQHQAVAIRQLPDPEIGLMAQNVPTNSFSLAQNQNAMLSIGISQRFPAFGKRAAQGRVARAKSQSALYGILATRAQSLLALRVAWVDAMYDQQVLAILRNQQTLDTESEQVALARFRAGAAPEVDALRAQLDEQALGNTVSQVQALHTAAIATIAALLARPDLPTLAASWPQMPTPPSLAAIEARLADNPLLREAKTAQQAAEAQVAVAHSAYYPNVTVSGSYGKSYYPGMPDQMTVGVTLSVPLFTADRQDQVLDAAQANAAASRDAQQQQSLRMLSTVHIQFAQYLSAQTQLERTHDTLLPTAQAAFAAALSTYSSGQTNMNSLLKTQKAVLQYALEEISLRRDLANAEANLDYLATGVEHKS
ncbi:MAG: TolC family protein [Acidiferrobacterales bacterium]